MGVTDSTIEAIHVRRARFPLDDPFRSAVVLVDAVYLVIVEVRVAGGAAGIGYAFAFSPPDARMIDAAVSELAALATGQDVLGSAALWQRMTAALTFVGRGGPALAALSAIDVAVWDAKARLLGIPIHRLLGGARESVAAYASAGSLALEPSQLVAEMEPHAAAGFQHFKVKLDASARRNADRLAALRSGLGDEVEIYGDGNQQWSAGAAAQQAQQLERFRPGWLEEPMPADDIDGLAELRGRIRIPVATGETNFGLASFDGLLTARAADILMPNIQRVGGVTGWLRVAEAAALRGIPVASHVNTHFALPLLCGIANASVLEFVPWWPNPFEEELSFRNGEAVVSQEPGFGLTLDEARLRHNAM
jgi:L-alanine-DL-glutamate epimerase-like enolase superfamily enzyme